MTMYIAGIAPTEAGDAQSDGVSQELNSTVLVTTAGGDNLCKYLIDCIAPWGLPRFC